MKEVKVKNMIGFYSGSFDPFTNGHLSIVKKASKCFEKIIIGIGVNSEKKLRVDKEEMKLAIEETIKQENLANVEVILYDNLTFEQAKKYNADILIRGLRNGTDYQYEENIAALNEIHANLDTCYFRAGNLGYLSSSVVMELYYHNQDISVYIPEPVNRLLERKRKENLL